MSDKYYTYINLPSGENTTEESNTIDKTLEIFRREALQMQSIYKQSLKAFCNKINVILRSECDGNYESVFSIANCDYLDIRFLNNSDYKLAGRIRIFFYTRHNEIIPDIQWQDSEDIDSSRKEEYVDMLYLITCTFRTRESELYDTIIKMHKTRCDLFKSYKESKEAYLSYKSSIAYSLAC